MINFTPIAADDSRQVAIDRSAIPEDSGTERSVVSNGPTAKIEEGMEVVIGEPVANGFQTVRKRRRVEGF